MDLETQLWYQSLGILVFGMAILIAGDLLYNFPAAPIAQYSFGTSNLELSFGQLGVQYYIFYGLIAMVLFL
jgi:hypothetical protein